MPMQTGENPGKIGGEIGGTLPVFNFKAKSGLATLLQKND